MTPNRPASAIHDFDFLAGTWATRQRRLRRRLAGCDDWECFDATSTVQRLPGGVANFDTLVAESWRPGWVGMSFRVYHPGTDRWSIHWMTNEGGGIDAASGHLEAPVVGRFDGDEGLFEGDDVFEGRPIRVRYRWTRRGEDTARWEQSFSADGGATWELNWVMDFERLLPATSPIETAPAIGFDGAVVEFRRYALHPGRREALIELFDREFVETQEAQGMAVLGQFRDLDAPDRFAWLRGFAGMDTRASALGAFYGGPVWQRHRDAANATMIDSDDVWLLRPAWPGAGIDMRGRRRATGMVRCARAGCVDVRVLRLREPAPPTLLQQGRDAWAPALAAAGAQVLGWYVTETAANDFPRLPVREGEHALACFALFDSVDAQAAFVAGGAWSRDLLPLFSGWLDGEPELLRLVPTARSALHA